MTPLTGVGELDTILHRLATARSRDEYDDRLGELATIAPNYITELDSLFDAGTYPRMPLIWCLIGQDNRKARALFAKAMADKDQYTRWAAVNALSKCKSPDASARLVAALKDRSHLVKGTAVDTFVKVYNPDAIPQLKKIAASAYLRTTVPGIVESARKALARYQ